MFSSWRALWKQLCGAGTDAGAGNRAALGGAMLMDSAQKLLLRKQWSVPCAPPQAGLRRPRGKTNLVGCEGQIRNGERGHADTSGRWPMALQLIAGIKKAGHDVVRTVS
eukprot:7127012-Prymnesium_polylepis.1